MTTVIPFIPSNLSAPHFLAAFDGTTYNVVVTWNVSAQRYYVNVNDLNGRWITTVPMFASPPGRPVEAISWDVGAKLVTVRLVDPSLWPNPMAPGGIAVPGTIVEYTLENFTPTTYNGEFRCLQIDPVTFSFPLDTDPGTVKIVGSASRILSMMRGIFQSTLIYRNGAFEISP